MSNFRHIRPLMLGLLVLAGSASAAAAATPPAPAPPACVLGAAPGIYANCVPIGVIPTITSSIDCAPGRYSSKVQPHGFPIGQTATFRLNLESRTDRAVSKVIVNGRLSPSQRSFVNRFLGRYDASDNALWSPVAGQVLVTLKADGRLAMTSTMDITGSNCRALIGRARRLRAFPALGADAPVDVQFKLNKGNCPWISGRYVTLHYNRALTGADVYQVEISLHPAVRGQEGQERQIWDLSKLQSVIATTSAVSQM